MRKIHYFYDHFPIKIYPQGIQHGSKSKPTSAVLLESQESHAAPVGLWCIYGIPPGKCGVFTLKMGEMSSKNFGKCQFSQTSFF